MTENMLFFKTINSTAAQKGEMDKKSYVSYTLQILTTYSNLNFVLLQMTESFTIKLFLMNSA